MAQIVLSDVSADAGVGPGTLFQGLRFFISHKVPQRSRFINDVLSNGGEVLPIEKHAEIMIVDHARKEALPGTYSYRYIEKSVCNGVLEDLECHRVGPAEGTVRSIGSTIQPPKGTRNKYTQDDDRILWNWVHKMPQKGGGTDGNEIYKQLEAMHPQHPWQSWRDRWIKQLKGKPQPFPLPHNAPLTPPSDVLIAPNDSTAAEQSAQQQKAAPHLKPPVKSAATTHLQKETAASPQPKRSASRATADDEYAFGSFDESDAEALMVNGESILEVPPKHVAQAWESWARESPTEQGVHTARDWQNFWEEHVCPRYFKRRAKQTAKVREEPPTAAGTQMSTPSRISKLTSQTLSSPITEKGSDASMGQKSPSYHPESPSMQLLSPSLYKERRTGMVNSEDAFVSHYSHKESSLAVRLTSAIDGNLKRKQGFVEDEIPSSSPPGIAPSPKRRRPNVLEPIREIASTPDMTPVRKGKRPDSPLFIGSEEDEENQSNLGYGVNVENPLGKQASDTLSECVRVADNTQAVFRDATQQVDLYIPLPDDDWGDRDPFLREPTQQIDFDIPPPDDGWDDEDSGAEASSEAEPTATKVYDRRPALQETQAILRGKTPALDLDVPEPQGGWNHVIPSSPPPMPSSPHAGSEVSDVDAQTETWINGHVAEGISADRVITVWKATSMDTSLAEEVLKVVGKDGELPRDMRGVWTETDDEDLGATDARKIQRLGLKHGKDGLTARWEFLDFYKSA